MYCVYGCPKAIPWNCRLRFHRVGWVNCCNAWVNREFWDGTHARTDTTAVKAKRPRAGRQPLPDHLPRIEHRHEPESCTCGQCGRDLVKIGGYAASINSSLLRAAARLVAPPEVSVTVFIGLGDLPLFNPDCEACPPSIVTNFRSQVAEADALLIASPEYAHGVTGTIKNALDWLVSFESFA